MIFNKLNKETGCYSSLYFLSSIPCSVCGILMPIYLINNLHFDLSEVALIVTLSGIGRAILTPLIGLILDYTQKIKLGIFLALLLTGLLLVFIFPYMTNINVAIVAYTLYFSLNVVFYNLLDRLINEYAQTHKTTYGQIRVFGSSSYVFFGAILPLFIGKNIDILIITFAGFVTLFMCLLICFLPKTPIKPKNNKKTTKFSFKDIFKYEKIWIAIISYQLLLCASATPYFYLSTYLSLWDAVWLTSLGIIMGSCLSEIPSFLFYKKIEIKYKPQKIFFYIILMTNIRWLLNIIFPGPLMFVLSMFFHGVLFAITTNFTLDLIIDNIPRHLRTTILTLMSSISMLISSVMQGIGANYLDQNNFTGFFAFFWIATIVAAVGYFWLFKNWDLKTRK